MAQVVDRRDSIAAMDLSEKPDLPVQHTEYAWLSPEDAEFMHSFTEKERKKVVRKVRLLL